MNFFVCDISNFFSESKLYINQTKVFKKTPGIKKEKYNSVLDMSMARNSRHYRNHREKRIVSKRKHRKAK
jgi:hypothetical protein